MDHRLHDGDSTVPGEGGKARPDDRLAQDLPVLLGHIPARPQPAARCHDHGCDPRCHALDPKDTVSLGFSASRPSRKLAFRSPRAPLPIKMGFLQCSTCAFARIG
jgi:hypothetical protein